MEYRYFLKLSYNGSYFHGWQSQLNAHTVQQELENCLSMLLQQDIQVVGAGRTDTGVHARLYYAHFSVQNPISIDRLENLKYKLNSVLPSSIAIKDVFPVKEDAHARFSALSRMYKYYVCRDYDPFLVGLSYRYTMPLNLDLMNQAAEMINDYTDFTCFTKSGTQTATNNCIVYESKWVESGNLLIYETRANRFLRNMVRAMVGTLLEVGRERITISEFTKILESGTRSDAGQSVPACGLFLEDVEYPESIFSSI